MFVIQSARRRPAPPSWRVALARAAGRAVLFASVVTGSLALGVGAAEFVQDVNPDAVRTEAPAEGPTRVERLVERLGCSETGLPEGVVPGSALIRDVETGAVRVESFDYGWKVYEGKGHDRDVLAAVCRAPVPTR